jgi:hypothetical protein
MSQTKGWIRWDISGGDPTFPAYGDGVKLLSVSAERDRSSLDFEVSE